MRVVIAEDSVLLREGLAHVLANGGFEVAAQVGDADALVHAVTCERPDVALIDVRMPPSHTDEGGAGPHGRSVPAVRRPGCSCSPR